MLLVGYRKGVATASAIKHPTIAKSRPRRPAAADAVKKATARLAPHCKHVHEPRQAVSRPTSISSVRQFNSPTRSNSLAPSHSREFDAMQIDVAEVKNTQEGTMYVLEEIKE